MHLAVRRTIQVVSFGFVAVALFLYLAGMHDGPIGIVPGGPLLQGEIESARGKSWHFVKDIEEIELQLADPPRSRTVWVVVHGNELYVPCGFLNVPLWKQWPHDALRDPRAVARIDGKRYEFELQRVEDEVVAARVGGLVAHKYLGTESIEPVSQDPETTWIFRLEPLSHP
ncbi:MAG: hypothetical protein ABFS46_21140 [Myxococcota bacterium]